jgi:2-polyprenyl-3-methyl-5-hydroxy-6-metoxy-1,4-benzoquinol methylase
MNKFCPLCDESDTIIILSRSPTLELLECRSCRFVYADREKWRNPYEKFDYYDETGVNSEAQYPLQPNSTDADRIASIMRFARSGKFIDVGGGLGTTAIHAANVGFHSFLMEESDLAVYNGSRYHSNVTWIHGREFPEGVYRNEFDVISMFHVLEHIPTPLPWLTNVCSALKPGGVVCIEVPNWGSHLRSIHRANWCYVLEHHVNYFTQRTLKGLGVRVGLVPLKIEYRRTFSVNEKQPWKEVCKKGLCFLGFGDVLRITFRYHPSL